MVYQVTANMSDFSEDELLQDLLDSQQDLLICWLALEIGATELETNAPKPDIAICSSCGWSGGIEECDQDEEGDWENGYYTVDLCPNCDDGGCIDNYDMSPERDEEWKHWYYTHSKTGVRERMDTNQKIATAIELEFKIRRMIIHQYDQESQEFKKVEAKSLIQNISIDKK